MEAFLFDPLYTQANLLLLGLFLGAAVSGLLILAKQKKLGLAVGQFWQQEQPLFGGWQWERRAALGPWLFLAAAVLLQYQAFFANSLVREVNPAFSMWQGIVIDHVLGLCLLAKILFASRYSGKQLALAGSVYFILRWVFMNNHNKWFFLGVLFLLAAKDVPLRKTLKACLIVGTVSVVAVGVASLAGLIPTVLIEGDYRPRNSFGYGWFNLLGAYLLGLSVMFVCWRRAEKLTVLNFITLAGVIVFCDRGPDSRGATISLGLLFLGVLIVRFLPKLMQWKGLPWLGASCPILAWGASVGLIFGYRPSPLFDKIDLLFSGRIRLAQLAYTQAGIKIAGQIPQTSEPIDNIYFALLVVAGPIASALVWLSFSVMLYKLLKNGHATEAVCCLAFLAHGFMEPHLTWPCVNVTLWLLSGVVFLKKGPEFPSFAEPLAKEGVKTT